MKELFSATLRVAAALTAIGCLALTGIFVYRQVTPAQQPSTDTQISTQQTQADNASQSDTTSDNTPTPRNGMEQGYYELKQDIENGYADMRQKQHDFWNGK